MRRDGREAEGRDTAGRKGTSQGGRERERDERKARLEECCAGREWGMVDREERRKGGMKRGQGWKSALQEGNGAWWTGRKKGRKRRRADDE